MTDNSLTAVVPPLSCEFAHAVERERQQEISDLISRLIERLGAPEVAIDERHTPALHSRFLHGLLRKYRRDLLAVSPGARLLDGQPPAARTANASANAVQVASAPAPAPADVTATTGDATAAVASTSCTC